MIDFHGAVVSFYVQIMLSRKRRTDLNLNSIFIRGIVWISKLAAAIIPETTGFPFFFRFSHRCFSEIIEPNLISIITREISVKFTLKKHT